MKHLKALEGLVIRVKVPARLAEKEFTPMNQLLAEFTQRVSHLETTQVAKGL